MKKCSDLLRHTKTHMEIQFYGGRTVQIQKVIVQQFVTQSPSVTFEFVTISNVTICYTFCDAPIVKSKLSQSVHPKYAVIHRSNSV